MSIAARAMSKLTTAPDGYQFCNITGKYYKLYRVSQTWAQGYNTCSQDGGNLAIIWGRTGAQVSDWFNNILLSYRLWVDGTDKAAEGTWIVQDGNKSAALHKHVN